MVEESETELLILKIKEYLESNPDDLDGAVVVAEEFINTSQIEPKDLLNLSFVLVSQDLYESAYVLSKASSRAQDNQIDISSFYISGLALHLMGYLDGAETEYQTALEIDSNNSNIHRIYGKLLQEMGHFAAAETEYQTALKIDPNSSGTHSDYGRLLQEMGCLAAAEMEHQKALETDPRNTYAHEAYAFFLFDKKNIEESLDEMRTVFKLLIGEGDKVGVHLFLAWINETIAEAYYEKGVNRKKKGIFSKSGKFASIAGKEYLLAAENAKDKEQNLYLTKGHTLKGRAAIRQLDLPLFASFKLKINTILHPHSYLELRLIFSRIHEAADNYEKVAEISAEENSTCLACCKCMRILCEVLDFVQAATIQSKVPDIDENIEKWKNELDLVEPFYEDSVKGTNFVQALRKMISSLSSFEKIKSSGRLTSGRELELFSKELTNVIDNIEGPLQDVITKSTEQMKKCAMKWAPYRDATEASVLKDKSLLRVFVGWINGPIISKVIGGLILFLVLAYFGLKD